jgi:hypothetical protein
MFFSMAVYSAQVTAMTSFEDFRKSSCELLIELDAATVKMMMLVSARNVSGPEWALAVERHRDAYTQWNTFLNSPVVKAKVPTVS